MEAYHLVIPQEPQREDESLASYATKHNGACLLCDYCKLEQKVTEDKDIGARGNSQEEDTFGSLIFIENVSSSREFPENVHCLRKVL
jgi:hypothetical protein